MRELPRKDYYGILRLPPGASPEIVKQRFRRIARELHPDVNPAPDAAERFREARDAYEVLTDPARRRIVDAWYRPVRGRDLGGERPRRPPFRERRAGPPPPRSGPVPGAPFVVRRAPWWAGAGSEIAAGFGCFGLPAFLATLLFLRFAGRGALRLALLVGLIFGLVATLGGSRTRERLLWLLSRWFWWW